MNQIYGPLATLSALECFGFFWTQAAKATRLQRVGWLIQTQIVTYRPKESICKKTEVALKSWMTLADALKMHSLAISF